MLRLPAVAGQFYPADPNELAAVVREFATVPSGTELVRVKACLVPHAGYMYSGTITKPMGKA